MTLARVTRRTVPTGHTFADCRAAGTCVLDPGKKGTHSLEIGVLVHVESSRSSV